LLFVLYRNRNRLKLPLVKLAYSLLYEAYRRQMWYFELADLAESEWVSACHARR
jgi:hypothetical protein